MSDRKCFPVGQFFSSVINFKISGNWLFPRITRSWDFFSVLFPTFVWIFCSKLIFEANCYLKVIQRFFKCFVPNFPKKHWTLFAVILKVSCTLNFASLYVYILIWQDQRSGFYGLPALRISDLKPIRSFDPLRRLCEVWRFNRESKQNFARHSDLSVEIMDPERHVKPWLEIRMILLEVLHQLSSKSQTETIACLQISYTKSWYFSKIFSYTVLLRKVLEICKVFKAKVRYSKD